MGNRSDPPDSAKQLPLEKLEICVNEGGLKRSVPALSDFWVDSRTFLRYEEPVVYDEAGREILGAKDTWLELTNCIIEDFDWLLSLPHHRFWSNVVHNRSIVDALGAFLVESPTFYTVEKFPNDVGMRRALEKLSRSTLMTFARIVTNRESPTEYMEREYHGQLIYDNYLMTIPIMWDLCQLYGRQNEKIVERILISAIKLNPMYSTDFQQAVAFITEVLQNIEQRSEGSNVETNLGEIGDMVVHLLDLATTLEIFLAIYPAATEFFGIDSFLSKLVAVYGGVLPETYARLHAIRCNEENLVEYTEVKHFLEVTRVSIVKVFRAVTFRDIGLILEEPDPSKVQDASQRVDRFLSYLATAVTEREFAKDYNAVYPIEIDLDLVAQITPEFDPLKRDFILQSTTLVLEELRTQNVNQRSSSVVQNSTSSSSSQANSSEVNPPNHTNSTAGKSDDLLQMIREVKDIMCDLGEGFIARCLNHYNNNPSAVINALLEDNLPPHLRELDRQMPYIPPDPTEASAAVDEIIGHQRLNVFDGDEFDIMTRDDIDKSRVHQGKKRDKYKNLNEMLNDKSFKNETRTIYEKYGMVEDEYDDEYDDTYDSQDVGPRGVDDPVEMDARPFTTPRVLRTREKPEDVSSEGEDTEEEAKSSNKNDRRNFCENPEVLRARAEERRQSMRGRGGPQGDTVGKPRGQGNDKNVLINRDKKNIHKSSRANHNRRSGAEWKRRQGMVPS